jgi:hypothetical protein
MPSMPPPASWLTPVAPASRTAPAEACRPAGIDDALTIQRRVAELLGEPIGGWKCSLPNPQQ